MTTMTSNLYDSFAKAVQTFSQESVATEVATQYAFMTFTEESEPDSVMYNECNTWKLLSIWADETKSDLQRYAMIRQWVAQVPYDKRLLEKIQEKKMMDQELEEELNLIVRKNRVLREQQDERPTKIRRKNEDALTESTCRERYKQLRQDAMVQYNDNTSLTYMCNEYMTYNQYALDPERVKSFHIKERLTWRDCVKHMAKDESLGFYERVLFNALSGNPTFLYTTEASTWEDVIWAYINGRVEDALDDPTRVDPLTQDIAALALAKDEVMEESDPRILFHHIQSSILSNTTSSLIEQLYDGYVWNNWNHGIYVSDQHRAQTLRFISTWILFGRKYLGWTEDASSTALLRAYTELNARPETFRPTVITSYAAALAPQDQLSVFSTFLEHFDGDKEECIVLSKLGKEYGLNMRKTLIFTSDLIKQKALLNAKPTPSPSFQVEPPTTENTDYDLFFRALHWLLIDEDLALKAVQTANEMIRFFFQHYKIYLVKQVFDFLPQSTYDKLMLAYEQGGEDAKAIDEFDLHRKVMLIFTGYKAWEEMMRAKPIDTGTFDSLQSIYDWRDEAEKQTVLMENNMKSVLEGNWLKRESNSSKLATRQYYIPEILIRYHRLLQTSVDVNEKNQAKSAELMTYVTEEHRELFDDITTSNRWEDVLEEFSKSLI